MLLDPQHPTANLLTEGAGAVIFRGTLTRMKNSPRTKTQETKVTEELTEIGRFLCVCSYRVGIQKNNKTLR